MMQKPALILLVEDSNLDVELTLDAFREAGLSNRIEVASNGQQAIDYLLGKEKYSDRESYPLPDMILLDLKMPGIDGFDVLERIKSTPFVKRIPVIILTSSKEQGDRALSYDIGANSYLVKPVSFSGFIDVVKQIDNYWLTLNVNAPTNVLGQGSPES
jgi:CheY-like chemotaxis protein